MTDVYRFSESEMILFSFVLLRMSAFVVSWPVFGVENISSQLKVLLALILSFLVFPTLSFSPEQLAATKSDLWMLTLREVFIGLSLGYLARLFFFAFQIAGEMISQAMGLGAATMFNPSVGGQTTSLEQFYVILASLFYLSVQGHHFLLTGLVQTFEFAPVAQLSLNVSQFVGLGELVQQVVDLGLRFSAPVVISILVVNLVLGVIGKTVPQLNVLVTSFPINIMIGFALMIITLPMLFEQMAGFLDLSTDQILKFMMSY